VRYEKTFYIADAGIERAKAELRTTTRTLNQILMSNTLISSFASPVSFGSGTYRIRVTDNDDGDTNLFADTDETVIIRSTGTYENVSRVIEACVRITQHDITPSTDGALSVYGTNTSVAISGNGLVDGRDYAVPVDFECEGSGCAGSLTTNPAVPGIFSITNTDISGTNKVTGGIITNGTSQFATNYWVEKADELLPQSTITLAGGIYNSDMTLGTREHPEITVITGDSKINGSVDGAGILIVLANVNVDLGGNFHYEGIVMLLGELNCTELGTARIFGSVLSIGDGVSVQIKGTAEVKYSSAALANLSNLQLLPRPLSVVYWHELK
jgi:hypothetical protein